MTLLCFYRSSVRQGIEDLPGLISFNLCGHMTGQVWFHPTILDTEDLSGLIYPTAVDTRPVRIKFIQKLWTLKTCHDWIYPTTVGNKACQDWFQPKTVDTEDLSRLISSNNCRDKTCQNAISPMTVDTENL